MSLMTDLKFALRSLARAKGLAFTVVLTLALGIGANAAIFSVVRGVLLRPLVNRDQDRLIYIRQSAKGIGVENANFSVPELRDLQARVKTLSAFGDFSTIEFTMLGLGEPRTVRAGVVGGSYFEVMGLRPVMGRLLNAGDDGPKADGAAVLTHRFWTTAFRSDPSVIGKTIRLSDRPATIVGVLEPVGALSAGNRDHRQRRDQPAPSRRDDGGRARAPDDRALRPAGPRRRPRSGSRGASRRARRHREGTSGGVSDAGGLSHRRGEPARPDHLAGPHHPAGAARRLGAGLRRRLLERREPDPGALGPPRRRAADSRGARRQHRRAASNAAGREPAAVRGRRRAGHRHRAADGVGARALRRPLFRARQRRHRGCEPALGRRHPRGRRRGSARVRAAPAVGRSRRADWGCRAAACGSRPAPIAGCALFAVTQIAASFVLLAGAGMLITTLFALQRQQTGFRGNVLAVNVPVVSYTRKPEEITAFYKEAIRRISRAAGRGAGRARHRGAVARSRILRGAVHGRGLPEGQRRRGSAGAVPHGVAGILLGAGRSGSSPAATSTTTTGATASEWSSSARASRSGCSRTWTPSIAG